MNESRRRPQGEGLKSFDGAYRHNIEFLARHEGGFRWQNGPWLLENCRMTKPTLGVSADYLCCKNRSVVKFYMSSWMNNFHKHVFGITTTYPVRQGHDFPSI